MPQLAFIVSGFYAKKFIGWKRIENIISFVWVGDAILYDEIHQAKEYDG